MMSSGPGFNLQTSKKEDLSTRLKTQNLKRAKNETRKLEHEGKKMDERLTELKFAMNREKEERERQGGGFWRSGQQDNGVTTYADEVLAKNKKVSSSGKTKIRLLKDKPLVVRPVFGGLLCGVFCGLPPEGKPKETQICPSCRNSKTVFCFTQTGPRPVKQKDRNSPDGASGSYDNSMLGGEYDEADQAASFQEALQAWRVGKAAQGMTSEPSPSTDRNQTPRGVAYSPVRTPTVNVDSSTATVQNEVPIEIKFNTSNLSYADRLLLKKHRRTDVEQLYTPREGADSRATPRVTSQRNPRDSAGSRGTPRVTPRPTPRKVKREKSSVSMKSIQIEDVDDADFDDTEERVDFRALFEAIQSTNGEPPDQPDPDSVSIVEVENLVPGTRLEQTGKYKIQEEGEAESWSTDKPNVAGNQKVDPKPPMSGKSRRRSARKSARSSVDKSTKSPKSDKHVLSTDNLNLNDNTTNVTQQIDVRLKLNRDKQSVYNDMPNRQNSFDYSLRTLSARSIKIESAVEEPSFLVNETNFGKLEGEETQRTKKARPVSAKSRPSTAKSRPQTGRLESRSGSRQASRPVSRATSRAASRIDHPGVLTKGPSEALREIARMTPTSDHEYKGMNDFLMMGVERGEASEKTATPCRQEEKVKVSYQLYNMAPRSWKPDFSIADSVPVDNIENDDAEDDRANSVMAYAIYSERMVSEMTERLVSRFGELPIDEDSLSDHSSGGAYRSLGEEYRTFTPRSSQNSPSVSGRGTPVQMARYSMKDGKSSPYVPVSARDMPRKSGGRARAQTPRASQSRSEARTPRRSRTFHGEVERPVSRAIVMEGTDLSIFDNVGDADARDQDDEDALDQLEWELASNTGRLTSNGKVSRMEVTEDFSDGDDLSSSLESIRSMSRLGHDKGYDINCKLRDNELEDERDASFGQDDDEDDVRALD